MRILEDMIARSSLPIIEKEDIDPLLDRIGEAKFVLIGEASHGTSDYYTWRARITQRLIDEKGFGLVAVEGDWPDCYRVNRYVRGIDRSSGSAFDVLHAFERWPTWMWANWEMVAFTDWLRRRNDELPESRKAGFYGLDVYSLFESMDAVLIHLQNSHPILVESALNAFSCFDAYQREPQSYGYSTLILEADCERQVLSVLQAVLANRKDGPDDDPEDHFNAEMNSRAAVDAERYYKAMVRGSSESWNLRDIHMMDTLDQLASRGGQSTKAVVWAHNTHVGDASATDMAANGMINLGQLCRSRHPEETVLVGFGGYRGAVIAADRWGAPMERMRVPEGREGSWEHLLHDAVGKDCLLLLDAFHGHVHLEAKRGHRAIGVVYHPARETYANYVPTVLPSRYDAFIFIEETDPVHPLHFKPAASREPPDTYPFAI
jgi:erythromycin esterase